MTTPGTPPIHGPMSGMMLKSPAIIPTRNQKGRPMMASPIEHMHADDQRDQQLAAEEAADGAVEPVGDEHAPRPAAGRG